MAWLSFSLLCFKVNNVPNRDCFFLGHKQEQCGVESALISRESNSRNLEKQATDEVLFDIVPKMKNEHTEPQDSRISSHPISFLSDKQASTLGHLNSESIAALKCCQSDRGKCHFVAGIKVGSSVTSFYLVLVLIPVGAGTDHSHSMENVSVKFSQGFRDILRV